MKVPTSQNGIGPNAERNRRIGIGFLVIGTLLTVGWPGEIPPPNEIRWLTQGVDESRGGLEFHGWSQAVTEEALSFTGPALSIELWLQPPSAPGVGNQEILSLVDGPGVRPFLLGQWPGGFLLRSRASNPDGEPKLDYYSNSPPTRVRHLAILLSTESTQLFVDGQAHEVRGVGAILSPGAPFGGRLLLGNSNTGWRAWRGAIAAIAFHDRMLLPDEIQEHAANSFDLTQLATRGKEKNPTVLYRLQTGIGPREQGLDGAAPPLVFPERVRIPTTQVFSFRLPRDPGQRWFVQDLLLNVLGFIPLGALIAWRRGAHGVVAALLWGLALSLLIELGQVWIDGRSSSAIDLFTNGSGALLGGILSFAAGKILQEPAKS